MFKLIYIVCILVKAAVYSRGKCLLKVGNVHFLIEKYILFKKKDVSNFFMTFNVLLTSHKMVPIFA